MQQAAVRHSPLCVPYGTRWVGAKFQSSWFQASFCSSSGTRSFERRWKTSRQEFCAVEQATHGGNRDCYTVGLVLPKTATSYSLRCKPPQARTSSRSLNKGNICFFWRMTFIVLEVSELVKSFRSGPDHA